MCTGKRYRIESTLNLGRPHTAVEDRGPYCSETAEYILRQHGHRCGGKFSVVNGTMTMTALVDMGDGSHAMLTYKAIEV
jgi:hypothetical protein